MRWLLRPGIVIITCVTVLQAVWLGLLLGGEEALRTAPLSALTNWTRVEAIGLLLVTVALASVALFVLRLPRQIKLMCLCPQMGLILVTAFRSVELVRMQHYADGVLRPWRFIAADQAPIIILALFYCVALVIVCSNSGINHVDA